MPVPAQKHKCTDNEGIEHEFNYVEWERWHIKNRTPEGNTASGISGRHRKMKKKGYTLRQVFGFEEIKGRDYSKPTKHHAKCGDESMRSFRLCLAKMARG